MSSKERLSNHYLAAVSAALVLLSSSAQAATLSSFFGAAIASGTAPYSDTTLVGTIEYAVFTEAAFENNFSGFDVPSGELAYAYQIINGALDPVSSNAIIGINNSVTGIGDFTVDGSATEKAPQFATLTPSVSAVWDFNGLGNNIPTNGNSNGLILTSTNLPGPATSIDIVVDGGGSAIAMVVTPSDMPIPEPTTLALAVVPMALMAAGRRPRQRN